MGKTSAHFAKIDGDVLVEELRKRGLDLYQASEEMGYSRKYLHECIKRGTIHPATIRMLNVMYGIKRVNNDEGGAKSEKRSEETIDYGKLYQVIYDAVYTAVKKAWMDE